MSENETNCWREGELNLHSTLDESRKRAAEEGVGRLSSGSAGPQVSPSLAGLGTQNPGVLIFPHRKRMVIALCTGNRNAESVTQKRPLPLSQSGILHCV